MRISSVLILIAAEVTQALGSSILKYAMIYRKSPNPNTLAFWLIVLLALVCFGGGFPLYASSLARMKLSVAQPVFSATMFVLVTCISFIFFKETITALRIIGMVVIIIGIVMVVIQQ